MSNDQDFGRRLHSALGREAGSLPQARDLTGEAMTRARSIRRRRRTATGVAVLALLAVAVPVGLQAADRLPQTAPAAEPLDGPEQLRLDSLDALPAGEPPVDQYAQNGVFSLPGGNGTTDFSTLDWIDVVAWGDAAAVTESLKTDGDFPFYGPRRLHLFDTQGARDVLVEEGAEYTIASADRRWLAYVDEGEAGATVTVADARTGRSDTVELERRNAELLAVVGGTVYIRNDTAGDDSRLRSWSADDGFRGFLYDAWMVSDDGTLVGAHTGRADGGGQCYQLVDLVSGDARWESCRWPPGEVSPDGRWVYSPSPSETYQDAIRAGYGPSRVAVLDAETGEPVRVLSVSSCCGPHGYGHRVPDARWESEHSLLLQVESAGKTAVVRLDVLTGEVELATEPVPYTAAESRRLSPPYLLG